MNKPALRTYYKLLCRRSLCVYDHAPRACHMVCKFKDIRAALGMSYKFSPRMLFFHFQDIFPKDLVVCRAVPFPGNDFLVSPGRDISSQVLVRHKDDLVCVQRVYHFHSVGRGAAYIGFCLYCSRAVYIRDNRGFRVFFFQYFKAFNIDHICHRAGSINFRQQNRFIRGKDCSAFPHKMDAAEDNNISVLAYGFLAQGKGVTDKICNVLDFGA